MLRFREIERLEEAIQYYDRVIEAIPKDSFVHTRKADMLEKMGRNEEVKERYDKGKIFL